MTANSIEKTFEGVKWGVTAKPNLHALSDKFSRILEKSITDQEMQLAGTSSKAASYEERSATIDRVRIGNLSKQNPSVSKLLISHPVYGKDCWKIIHSSLNRNKAFTNIWDGTSIYLNPKTLEITWQNEPQGDLRVSDATVETFNRNRTEGDETLLGKLSDKIPTVSHLLVRHPAYGKDCWPILSSELNKYKEFSRIQKDTPVYINNATGEITWGEKMVSHAKKRLETPVPVGVEVAQPAKSDPFSEKLANAVKPYIGTSYNRINCFELVVHALEKTGIQYRGADGLGSRLIKEALAKGLPENHYLSGEGLIKTSGALVYTKSFANIRRPGKGALAMYREIEPLLRKGQILSFSTPSRGHTGIVSKRSDRWTYINSGNMDHTISGRRRKGVGEESLRPEIANWFRLAAAGGETLSVTIGVLNESKLKGEPALLHTKAGENRT